MIRRHQNGAGRKARGFGILGWVLMIPIVIIGLLILAIGFFEARKAYWDYKVREMCEKDGGVRVFETVRLDRQQYSLILNQFGQLSPPLENKAADNVPIVRKFTSTYIRRNDPEVRRDELVVIRRSDEKVLGVSVSYSRVGGDLIALHPSNFSCSEKSRDIFAAIVQPNEEQE